MNIVKKRCAIPVAVILTMFVAFSSYGQKRLFSGDISNGMKGDKCTFELSADGKTLSNFTFKGYWRCDRKLESITVGPIKSAKVVNGKFDSITAEPENRGATAFRFELHGSINGNTASGTYRMNINALACDSYVLNWTARAK